MIFDISVQEVQGRASLPWVVVLSLGSKTLEYHVKTREKAIELTDKFQNKGWSKVYPASKFLSYLQNWNEAN